MEKRTRQHKISKGQHNYSAKKDETRTRATPDNTITLTNKNNDPNLPFKYYTNNLEINATLSRLQRNKQTTAKLSQLEEQEARDEKKKQQQECVWWCLQKI